jgi:Protein of unknown function (DUF732)
MPSTPPPAGKPTSANEPEPITETPASAAPTNIAPITPPPQRFEPRDAWSSEQPELEAPNLWPTRIRWAAATAVLIAAILTLAWMAWTLAEWPHRTTTPPPVTVTMRPPPPSTVTLPPSTTTLAAPPPVTVTLPPTTVTAPPRPITPRHFSDAEDEKMLATLRSWGWEIHNPPVVVDTARTSCLLMHEGHGLQEVVYIIAAETDVSLHDAGQLVSAAAGAYSNC